MANQEGMPDGRLNRFEEELHLLGLRADLHILKDPVFVYESPRLSTGRTPFVWLFDLRSVAS